MLHPDELYFDHNSTCPLLPEVREELGRLLEEDLANPASEHEAGRRSARLLRTAREEVAELLGCESAEILFTSGGSEANLLAIAGLARATSSSGHVVGSQIEHAAVLGALDLLEELGYRVSRVPCGAEGLVEVDAVLEALRPETCLVTLMSANNETGVLQPVSELAGLLAERGIAFHVDAVQSIGRTPLRADNLAAHSIAISGHKLGAAMGIGALFLRRGTGLRPLLRGGHQERGLRTGTLDLLGAVGLGVAARAVRRRRPEEVAPLRDRFESRLAAALSEVAFNGAGAPRLANTSSVYFPGVDASRLLGELSRRGLHASLGSACQAGSAQPSHVLRAMGYPARRVLGTLRFSFGTAHSRTQIEQGAELVIRTVKEFTGRRS